MYLTPFYESDRGDRARIEKYPQVPTPLLWNARDDKPNPGQADPAPRSPVTLVTTQTNSYLDFLRDARAELAAAASRLATHGEKHG